MEGDKFHLSRRSSLLPTAVVNRGTLRLGAS